MSVFLHIGEPKTGTTFLQQVMWRNRTELAEQGVLLAGHSPHDHFRAAQDLRDIPKLASDPAAPWTGEWDILAEQASLAPRTAVISHELLSAVTPEQADRAVRSFSDTEVHVVLTVRDMATLLPAEWQETIKHRNTRAYDDWLGDVIDVEAVSADRRQWWFWRVHDTLQILAMWSSQLPPDRLHVITVPRRGTPQSLLWTRMAAVLDVRPDSVDTTRARSNASLGMPEIEFMRRLNEKLSEDVPGWFYMHNVKEPLAHGALAARSRSGTLVLPITRDAWAREWARVLVEGLDNAGYDVVGDVADLDPPPPVQNGEHPGHATPEQMLDAAVVSLAALVERQYRRGRRGPATARPAGLRARAREIVRDSPRLRRTLRVLTSRYRWATRLRVLSWQRIERRRGQA